MSPTTRVVYSSTCIRCGAPIWVCAARLSPADLVCRACTPKTPEASP